MIQARVQLGSRLKGMTLIELLIVIAIIVLLASVTLPSLKTILKDRKTSSAATQIRAYLESAKARGIAKNRDVAVVIERMPLEPLEDEASKYIHRNTAVRLSMADVLPPYRGDLNYSVVNLSAAPSSIAGYNPQPPPPLGQPAPWLNEITIDLNANPTARYFLNLGDEIAFDDQSHRFEIVQITPFPIQASDTSATIVIWNQPPYNNPPPSRKGTMPIHPVVPLVAGDHRFRIYSKPRRLFSKTLDLPKGTCIDLSLSGVGPNGRGFSTEMIHDVPNLDAPATPQPAAFFKPIYVVFNSRGTVSCLYGNAAGASTMDRYLPLGNIYLMVGRTDQVFRFANAGDPTQDLSNLSNGVSPNDPFINNLADSSAYWVKIAPNSGQISTAPNLDPRSSGAVGIRNLLNFSRGLSSGGVDVPSN